MGGIVSLLPFWCVGFSFGQDLVWSSNNMRTSRFTERRPGGASLKVEPGRRAAIGELIVSRL
jgi:hypothetical protein